MECWWFFLLLSLLGDVDVSDAYNVEVSEHRRFSGNTSSLYGYKVAQLKTSNGERLLIGDPGGSILHACDVISGKCDLITLPSSDDASHLGLTLEVEHNSSRCLICGHQKPHDCSKTLYTNGACYTVNSTLTASQMEKPGYQKCQIVEVDLCFLIDDSHSVGDPEFKIIQEFLLSAVQDLKNKTVHFAVVQFDSTPKKILDFNDYQRGEGEQRIEAMKHRGGASHTYQAIGFALDNIFTPKAGVRKQAKKILILVTDGDANDKISNVTARADKEGVTRYVIAIGKNYKEELIHDIASSPVVEHTRLMTSYSYLKDFFTELQNKILAIEGVQQGSSFTLEMSSAGFSAALLQDRQILGDPGIYDWSGGIIDISKEEQLINMSQGEEDKYGYLGYSIKLFHTPHGLFCVVGSPRFKYVGLVTVLKEEAGGTWNKIDSVEGKQVGSYFGAEIAIVDLDQDGVTDLVLISAPHHYEMKWSGEVSVCRFTEMLNCTVTLHGEPGHLHSQFGAAVSSLGDLDGDGYSEVAVGAPYEMSGGALYIYKGEPAGLSTVYIQRLPSPQGIMGFGLSVHGVLDMTEDGLIDVVVGSRGHATFHRSKPLLNVSVSVTSNQTYMLVSSTCDNELILEACLRTEVQTHRYTGFWSMSIHYSLVLDSHKPESRMFFTNQQREMNGTVVIQRPGVWCENYTIALRDCDLDDVSEVQVSLTAFPEEVDSLWLLSRSSNLCATSLISFKMCEGQKCEPDMSIQVYHSQLVVKDGESFSMFLSLQNMDVKAHQTRLSISAPSGLYYRKANVSEMSHKVSVVCGDLEEQILMCNVSHPFLRRRVKAVIQIMFSIVSNMSWADHILLFINVTSDGNVTSNVTEHVVPVLYPIHITSRSLEDSTKHISLTNHGKDETAAHRYQIENSGLYAVPINLSVSVSSLMKDVTWAFNISYSQNSGANCFKHDDPSAILTYSNETETMITQIWQCFMDKTGKIIINITGPLNPMSTWKEQGSVSMRSEVTIRYNELRYHSENMYHTAKVVTHVDLLVIPNHIMYIAVGTGIGLVLMVLIIILLYKFGFFRREYKGRMMETNRAEPEVIAELMAPPENL